MKKLVELSGNKVASIDHLIEPPIKHFSPMRSFTHSTNVLIKAYLNDTLEQGQCTACAVGNLIADAMNLKIDMWTSLFWVDQNGKRIKARWVYVFSTRNSVQEQEPLKYFGVPKRQIDSTGYTWQELARIEYAFEKAEGRGEERMFNGLVAVFSVLADIHQVDLTTRTQALEALSAAKPSLT